jgi:hypothetical protein
MVPLTTTHTTNDVAHHTGSRLPGVTGVLSVIAMVAAFLVVPADAGGSAPADIAQRYDNGSAGYLRASVFESLSMMLLLVLVAGLCDLLRRHPGGDVAATAVGLGGGVLAACQLVGYGLIATLALGTAGRGDEEVVMALYDASAVAFVVSYVGLALVGLGTATVLVRARGRLVVGGVSLVVGVAAAVGSSTYAAEGVLSPHGDLGFVILLFQMIWAVAVSVSLLRHR